MTAYALFHGWVQGEIDGIQINGKNYSASKIVALETENAALTARVRELSEDRDSWRRVSERLERDSVRQASEKEALETQLAAARKALQEIAINTSLDAQHYIARAALEDKP